MTTVQTPRVWENQEDALSEVMTVNSGHEAVGVLQVVAVKSPRI